MNEAQTAEFSSADLSVLKKLVFFAVLMFIFPISTFFLLQKTLPKGNVIIPVGGSVIAVHIVILMYVWVAMKECADADAEPLKKD